MYANSRNPYFNSNSQYAFMRKYRNEVVLIVVDFDKSEQTVRVKIPSDAFLTLGFDDNKGCNTDGFVDGRHLHQYADGGVAVSACFCRLIRVRF